MVNSRQLTIACIAADLVPGKLGGAELHAVEVIKRLARRHKIILFVGANPSIKTSLPKSVTVVPVHYPRIPNFMGLCYIIIGYLQIKQHLQNHAIDILWAKQSYPQAFLAALLKQSFHQPLYITAQNPLLHQEELVLTNFLLKSFQRLLTHLVTPLIAWSFRQADLVAAVSQYSQQLAKQLGATNITIVPNGINLPKTSRTTPKTKTLRLFSASALIPRNGIDVLIAAVSLLPSNINWQLTVAGDGPEKNHLQAQINHLNLKSKIILLGRIPNQQIPTLLQQSDIFIRPSRWEGFGVAFIEAMALRTPVIATPVGGITDFIKHRHTGLLAQVENPQSIANNIRLLNRDRHLSNQLIRHGYNLVKQKYTWDKISLQVETHLISLCH